MKKLAVSWVVAIILPTLYASPIGNTSFPQILQEGLLIPSDSWVDLRSGYEGDFVYDGRMEQYREGSGRVDDYEQTTNAGTVTINVLDRLDMYGLLGSSRTHARWRFFTAAGALRNAEIEA